MPNLVDHGLHLIANFQDGNKSSGFIDYDRETYAQPVPSWTCCATSDIEHCTTKPKHPWTNGQVERMNRTIEDATVRRFYYESQNQLRQHLADFIAAYNFGRRLKTLKGLTPYEFICKAWASQPERFTLDPLHQMPGLNSRESSHQPGIKPSDPIYLRIPETKRKWSGYHPQVKYVVSSPCRAASDCSLAFAAYHPALKDRG
ncbi:hypothetical protein ACVIRM_001747 [Rhizobium laguerreae]